MARRQQTVNKSGDMQPDELKSLKGVVDEFLKRLSVVDNEIETLKEDRKELIDEYSDRIDMRTLQQAMKIVKIKQGVVHKDAFDTFLEVLENDSFEEQRKITGD